MPQLSKWLQFCVFFLYRKDMEKDGETMHGPFGTGMIVELKPSNAGSSCRHFYAVTARHILKEHSAYSIRLNTLNGAPCWIHTDSDRWVWETRGPDIAIADITEELKEANAFYTSISAPFGFLTKQDIFHRQVTIGEDGFMLGLFHDLPGEVRNMVAGRFGNIALMADDEAKIKLPNGNHYPAHLFDIRSRPGFSGSPVFIYRVPTSDLTDFGTVSITVDNKFMKLLGIHVAQYNDYVDEIEIKREAGKQPRSVKTGRELQIPNSVTIVIPTWEIESLLMHKALKDQREAREMDEESRRIDERAPTPESAPSAESAPVTTPEGDEKHRERFTALQDAVLGKPKRGD